MATFALICFTPVITLTDELMSEKVDRKMLMSCRNAESKIFSVVKKLLRDIRVECAPSSGYAHFVVAILTVSLNNLGASCVALAVLRDWHISTTFDPNDDNLL